MTGLEKLDFIKRGKDGGYLAKVADRCVIIPIMNKDRITPHAESFASVIGHFIVSVPALQSNKAKLESVEDEEE